MTVNEVVVESPIASAMGARVKICGPGRGMYLVIGRGLSPELPVRNAGGEVVLRLNGQKMLVTLSFPGYLSLRGNHSISHIGPVTVDLKRLAKVAQALSGQLKPNGSP